MKKLFLILFLCFTTAGVFAQNTPVNSFTSVVNEKNITISPNPATVNIKISIVGKEANIKSVSIYNIIGSQVFSQQYINTKNIDLNIQDLKKGKYTLRVIFDDNSTEASALIKQ